MKAYLTTEVDYPWTDNDILNYEKYGTQCDEVIYNSAYNLRIKRLMRENSFLCSIKRDGYYRNFYLLPKTRSKFFITYDIPQFEVFKDNELQKSPVIKKCLSKLTFLREFIESAKEPNPINEYVTFIDCSSVLIEVNANIDEFLFPLAKKITNREIGLKIELMDAIYMESINQFNSLLNAFDRYNELERQQLVKIEKHREMCKEKFFIHSLILVGKIALLVIL